MNIISNRYIQQLLPIGVILIIGSGLWPMGANAETKADINRGAQSWANNCARCHNMRDTKEFPDYLWKPVVTHMRLQAGLTGQQARDILAFLQSSNYTAVATASDTGSVKVTGSPGASGDAIFKQTCIACHGANGEGAIPGVPKFSERLSKSDETLLNHIKNGFQSEGSPMAMPAKGGNPALSDADLVSVLNYIRKKFSK